MTRADKIALAVALILMSVAAVAFGQTINGCAIMVCNSGGGTFTPPPLLTSDASVQLTTDTGTNLEAQ